MEPLHVNSDSQRSSRATSMATNIATSTVHTSCWLQTPAWLGSGAWSGHAAWLLQSFVQLLQPLCAFRPALLLLLPLPYAAPPLGSAHMNRHKSPPLLNIRYTLLRTHLPANSGISKQQSVTSAVLLHDLAVCMDMTDHSLSLQMPRMSRSSHYTCLILAVDV